MPGSPTVLLCLLLLATASPAKAIVDSNGNGCSDVWERMYGASGLQPDGDADGDGMTNAAESVAGTDPFDRDSVPKITAMKPVSDGFRLTWSAVAGITYRVETCAGALDGPWRPAAVLTAGATGPLTAAVFRPPDTKAFFRVAVAGGPLASFARESGITTDSDGDGQSDLNEFMAGTDPFDAGSRFQISDLRTGSGLMVEFQTVPRKHYQLQSLRNPPGTGWRNEGPAVIARGTTKETFIANAASALILRLAISDADSDGDGASDWEEYQLGLDPFRSKSDETVVDDFTVVSARLSTTNVVGLKPSNAIANITRMTNGSFELTRSGGIDKISIHYTVSGTAVAGSDFVSLSGVATIPFGRESVEIPVIPVAASTMALSRSVIVTLQDTAAYDLDDEVSQQVNVLREVPIDVKNYGAVGDGVTDDTVAVQAALDALVASPLHNTLYFPSGKYRLNQVSSDNYTHTSNWHILRFGDSDDLTGRDIFLRGDGDSILYSTVSPTRAHMMVVIADFRSLTCSDLTWEKDSVPLSEASPGTEPSGADGVSLVAKDLRIVEHVLFEQCQFINCHGALMVTANGYDRRGHLRRLEFHKCKLLNPYGSNTVNGGQAWGGGQQTYLSQWVGDAIYRECLFEGGGEDMTDQTTSPGGRLKDAAMIGGPQRLIFRNNTVRRMGIEAVFNNGRAGWMGQTLTNFTVPPADGATVATVRLWDYPTTFTTGQSINLATSTTPTIAGRNSIFRVVSYDSGNRILGLVNDGYSSNAEQGSSIPMNGQIYLESANLLPLSRIENNVIEGEFPPGTDRISYSVGITMNTRALIRNNTITGYVIGVMSYDEARPNPWSKGLIVDSNLIITKDSEKYLPFGVIGVRSWAKNLEVTNNLIFVPIAKRSAGVAIYGDGAIITNNTVIAMRIERHEYDSPNRAVALAVGNTATNTVFEDNSTYGFDVGIGCNPYQSVSHRVISHHSYNDTLSIDPHGLIAE